MDAKKKALLVLPLLVIVTFLGYSLLTFNPNDSEPPTLEFPIAEHDNIVRLGAYHTPDWGEPGVFHNGIDLVISDDVTIISPTAGTITEKSETINTYGGNVLFSIVIEYNWAWEVKLVLEPDFYDGTNNSLQSDMIDVEVGQAVETGDDLATLLYSGPSSYPHLHYMLMVQGADVCAYNYSSASAKSTFEDIALDSGTRILYSYESPDVASSPDILRSPKVLILLAAGGVYTIFVIIVLKKSR